VWLLALKSATQSIMGVGGVNLIKLKESMRYYESHSSNHGVEGGDCCGGARGGGRNAREV
jgi:hypothetical protein